MPDVLAKDVITEIKQAGDAHKNFYRYDTMREVQYNYIVQIAKKIKPKNILDIGCAYGCLAILLTRNGFQTKTLDIEPKFHSKKLFRKYGIPFRKVDIEIDPIPYKEKFDFIVFAEVLEHLRMNPLPTLKKLASKMKKKSYLFLSTPAREINPPPTKGLWTAEINWRQIPHKERKWVDGHHHIYYFWELVDLVKEAGLKIEALKRMENWLLLLRKV